MAITVIEVLSFKFSSNIMDSPNFGRKKSVYYGSFAIAAVSVVIILSGEQNQILLFLCFMIIKFIVSATFMVIMLQFRFCILIQLKSMKH
jgi:hypothetical protein